MLELAAILNRLSVAVQFAVVMCLFGYFLLLGFVIRLREIRLWMLAWMFDALALTGVFVHVYADMPPLGHRLTLVAYLAGKTAFAVLLVAGARHHLRPGVRTLAGWPTLAAIVALWSTALGLGIPRLWQAQLLENALVASVFIVGAFLVLSNPRSRVSLWLGWAMGLVGTFFAYSAALLIPALWGSTRGFMFLAYSSFIEAGVELVLALACIAVIAQQREQQLNYANRELIDSQQRLSRLQDIDPLTHLGSRRTLRRALDEVARSGGSLIFIDINRFRDVNLLFGHRVGDLTLQRLADLVQQHFRPEDRVIRWGGDQFLVLAPGLDEAGAGERLAALRADLPHRTGDLPRFSVAAGIAHLEPGADPKTALEAADRRLAAGKLRGRSR
jgi:diguanylate cyclase (GGDEF)-like protein